MGEQLARQRKLARGQRLEQVELARKRDRAHGIDAARDREHWHQHGEREDQQHRPQEFWDRQRHRVHAVDCALHPSATPVRGGQRQQHAAHHRQRDRHAGEFQCRGQPPQHESEHILLEADRGAEIALHHLREVEHELHRDGFVQPVGFTQPGDIVGRGLARHHHRDGVAGHDAQQYEHHHRDPEERRDREQQPAQDVSRRHGGL